MSSSNRLTPEQDQAGYEAGHNVYLGRETRGAAIRRLVTDHALNQNSARIYVENYEHLRRGVNFKRTLSGRAFEMYLDRIHAETGDAGLRLALHALRQHLEYYEKTHTSSAHTVRTVVADFESRLVARSLQDVLLAFEQRLRRAAADSPDMRRERLQSAPADSGATGR